MPEQIGRDRHEPAASVSQVARGQWQVASENQRRFRFTSNWLLATCNEEVTTMAGIGRFKLSDAMRGQQSQAELPQPQGGGERGVPVRKGKGRGKRKSAGGG